MKQYFAKYLPVEGEIKEGIKVKYSGGKLNFPDTVYTVLDNVKKRVSVPSVPGYGIYHHISTEELENGKKKITGSYLKIGYNIEEQEVHIVKLFLCSRDIQVGDIITNLTGYDLGKAKEILDDDRIMCEHGYYHQWPDAFKKIGEISLEATWVKEGDEFDEDQVGYFLEDNSVKPIGYYNNYKVAVKGPCGYFH